MRVLKYKLFKAAQKQRKKDKKDLIHGKFKETTATTATVTSTGSKHSTASVLDLKGDLLGLGHSMSLPALSSPDYMSLRNTAAQLKMSRQTSLEGIQSVKSLQLESDTKMKQKLNFTLSVMSRKKKEAPAVETRQKRSGSPSNTPSARLYSPPATRPTT